MKHLVLSLAAVGMAGSAAPTWASLPVYEPRDFPFNSNSDIGYLLADYGDSGIVTPDGRAACTMVYINRYDVHLDYLSIAVWRGQTTLPTPKKDSVHINPKFRDMNRSGWICGYTTLETFEGGERPALWRPGGSRIDLPLLSGATYGQALGVNDARFVAGRSDTANGESRPVYWTPSAQIVELENPFASFNQLSWTGSAQSISSTGIIAGSITDYDNNSHAMRWDINGTAPILSQTMDTGLALERSWASQSLDDGTILGSGRIGITHHGVLWKPDGEAIQLRKLDSPFPANVFAYDINNNHYSVGQSGWNAVRWSPTGEPFALDPLPGETMGSANTAAYGINDFSFAVGMSDGMYYQAVLWTPDGDAIDLNSFVEYNPAGTMHLYEARFITNTGWISGVGTSIGDEYWRPFSILVPFAGTYGMGDANFDESIDFADLLIVAQHYGSQTNGSFDVGDFNLDGSVDFNDLLAIAQHYGESVSLNMGASTVDDPTFVSDWQAAQSMVPEPGVVGVMIGVGAMLRRRNYR